MDACISMWDEMSSGLDGRDFACVAKMLFLQGWAELVAGKRKEKMN